MAVDWREYAKGVEKQLEQLRRDLEPLESGRIKLGDAREVTPGETSPRRQSTATSR
jgi:hypothetical protein